jgi:PEGA domain-containing protein/PDZ domain-containing protein
VRLFITDDPLFETYAFSHGSAGFYANASGAGGAAHSAEFAANPNGKADPRTVELQANMQKSCPQFTVTSNIQNADYILWFRRNDQHRTKMLLLLGATGGLISAVQKVNGASLFAANGDMVYATRESTVGSTVKDICKHVPNPTPQALGTSQRIADSAPPVQAGATPAPTALSTPSVLTVNSAPAGAEIYLDGDFAGNAPSTINAPPGKHVVTVRKAGFQDWVRSVNFTGGAITLAAGLAPGSGVPVPANSTNPESKRKTYAVTGVSSAEAGKMRVSSQSQNSTAVIVETPPGWIGVLTKPTDDGALVASVFPHGPAAQAGLQAGDVIQRLNGVIVKGPGFDESIAKLKPGTKVVISYMRSAWAHETLVAVTKTPE